ncbi:MAG: zinc-dependent metalloprotease, partial [Gemmatimonadota bacterium]|nr:zinc-dependent metalloprotease [Gemmatimonadota bacterium]
MQLRTCAGIALPFLLVLTSACSTRSAGATSAVRPAAQDSTARPAAGATPSRTGPKPYAQVVTDKARTRRGLFSTHQVDDKLFFEIPAAQLGHEMLFIARVAETSQQAGGFVGGGGTKVLVWERDGHFVVVRSRDYGVRSDPSQAIARATDGMTRGAVLARLAVEAYGPDSAAVVDVTSLFLTANADFASLTSVQRDRSWIDRVVPTARTVDVEATQTGMIRAPNAPPTVQPTSVTARIHWSMYRLPDTPMMMRLSDRRVGVISSTTIDYSRPEHRAEERRFIHRFRLEKRIPGAALSDPVEPIVYWIDAATPDWLKPWVKSGVEKWNVAFREAGFTNAIEGRVAPTPEQDPDWSNHTLGKSIIYWRPSTVANATGGQVVDPRSGEIIKGEVNMYHNVMNLLRNWYFIQVSPLDPRGRALTLPDSLMGKLVEYVVTHEIGHSIGFPHNMKASHMYHPDSLRSVSFLRRMGGHVSTLMDYSRFNYVAQPEDNIPVDLLIPQVGPYDKYSVMWAYKPIPGARTPDEEWTVLDGWSRWQDTMPWLRWTTSDAPNDPANLTEAVGDMDPVYSTGLALRNLRRVMSTLIPVAERPGQDYTQLEELYSNAVQQWQRYMNHVAAVIGGADTQEKYGTGARFEPVSRARQQAAMRFLAENAFTTPDYLVTPDILRRIEAAGVLDRL